MVIKKIFTNSDSQAFKMYLSEISNFPVLTADEEIELVEKAQNGDKEAFNKVVNCNLRFVVTLAKQFMNKRIKLSDLVNEGNIGLINSVNKFDTTRGFKFITFAKWDIKQKINIYLEENVEYFKIPSGKVKANSKIKSAINILTIEYNRQPTKNEISEYIGEEITDTTLDIVLNIQNMSVISFDKPQVNDNGDVGSMVEIIPGDEEETSHLVEENLATTQLKQVLSILTDTERKVIINIYGLYGHEVRTMSQVGEDMGFTSSRIQQIASKTLSKLKDLSGSKAFQSVLN